MNRRRCLALLAAGAVPVAGCADSSDGDNESDPGNDSEPAGNVTNPPDDNTTDPDGNTSDPPENDGGNQTDDEPEGPTEQEFAAEDVASAQASLQAAVDELANQGNPYADLTSAGSDPITGGVSGLSAGPVRDHLSSVQSSIDAAREHETTSGQDSTISQIARAKTWLHALLDAQPPIHEAYLQANYGVQDYAAEDAEADVQAIRRAADEAGSVESALRYDSEALEDLSRVDAASVEGARQQTQRLVDDLASATHVADAIEALQAADDLFWPALEKLRNGEWGQIDGDPFEEAKSEFRAATNSAGKATETYGQIKDYADCYAAPKINAAEKYQRALINYRGGLNRQGRNRYEEGEAILENASGCEFGWSA